MASKAIVRTRKNLALTCRCPQCNAEPGEPCLTSSEVLAIRPHITRYRLAMKTSGYNPDKLGFSAAGEPMPFDLPETFPPSVEIKVTREAQCVGEED